MPESDLEKLRYPIGRFELDELGEVSLAFNLQLYAWHGKHHVHQILALRDRERW